MAEPTLAERLVRHPVWSRDGFGWQPGMVSDDGAVVVPVDRADLSDRHWCVHEDASGYEGGALEYIASTAIGLHDIEHPATQGCMMAMLRRAAESLGLHPWQLPMVVHETRDLWSVRTHNDIGGSCFYGRTVGEAIARALLWAFDRLVEQEAG